MSNNKSFLVESLMVFNRDMKTLSEATKVLGQYHHEGYAVNLFELIAQIRKESVSVIFNDFYPKENLEFEKRSFYNSLFNGGILLKDIVNDDYRKEATEFYKEWRKAS